MVDYSELLELEVGKLEWALSTEAKKSGCLANISVGGFSWQGIDELAIPFTILPEKDGKQWLKSEHNLVAQVEAQLFGSTCICAYRSCNIKLPCSESEYCFYYDKEVDNEYTAGSCLACPTFQNGEPDPAGSFFGHIEQLDKILIEFGVC